jgi:hypothetical protein
MGTGSATDAARLKFPAGNESTTSIGQEENPPKEKEHGRLKVWGVLRGLSPVKRDASSPDGRRLSFSSLRSRSPAPVVSELDRQGGTVPYSEVRTPSIRVAPPEESDPLAALENDPPSDADLLGYAQDRRALAALLDRGVSVNRLWTVLASKQPELFIPNGEYVDEGRRRQAVERLAICAELTLHPDFKPPRLDRGPATADMIGKIDVAGADGMAEQYRSCLAMTKLLHPILSENGYRANGWGGEDAVRGWKGNIFLPRKIPSLEDWLEEGDAQEPGTPARGRAA